MSFKNSDIIPLYQMIAKNVGIRRSRAALVVCTNVDLLFSDDLMEYLSNSELRENTFYRANRCDIPRSIDEAISVEQQLEFAKCNVLQRLGKNSLYPELSDTTGPVFALPYFGWLKSVPKKAMRFFGKRTVQDVITTIDTDACGDFTMMSKSSWENIKGYYELDAYSIHIDSLALLCATAVGMKQKTLDKYLVTFHISHDDGWELSDPVSKLYNDIKKPKVDWSSVHALGKRMIETKELIQVNGSDWGLYSQPLTEYVFAPGMPMQVIENG